MTDRTIICEKDAPNSKEGIKLGLKLSERTEIQVPDFEVTEESGEGKVQGRIFQGDCMEVCGRLAIWGEKVDLVYIDPPFATGSQYGGKIWLRGQADSKKGLPFIHYQDRLTKGEYLEWLGENLRAIRTVMSEQGCIYLHLDWHICHYAKVLMDQIFGEKNFLNEIIWTYKSGGASKNAFAKKHDVIYLYAKNKGKHIFNPVKEKSYNRDLKPYHFKGVEEFQDEIGWFTMVNMRDVWDINMVGRTAAERVDYATQKPEALLERMITASSNPNMLVADFFGGSGVTAAVASKLNRKFIHGDLNPLSKNIVRSRLKRANVGFEILERHKENDECTNELLVETFKTEQRWITTIVKYNSEKITEQIEEFHKTNQERLARTASGIEMIEWISADCEGSAGIWHSSEERYINKEGKMIANGKTLNLPWDGTIVTKKKPKRIKVRDIIGEEKEIKIF